MESNMAHGSRCTIERRSGKFCDRPSASWAPFPICKKHAVELFLTMDGMVESTTSSPAGMAALLLNHLDERRPLRAAPAAEPVVYFVMIDGLVKIGYTSDLTARLRTYPPTAQLLATEPGGRERERTLHAEFGEYLSAGREWFTPGPRLRGYIEALPTYEAA